MTYNLAKVFKVLSSSWRVERKNPIFSTVQSCLARWPNLPVVCFAWCTYYLAFSGTFKKEGYWKYYDACHVFVIFRNNPLYIKYYMNVARTIMLGILPFSALIFFNIKIYKRFLRTRARYQRENNSSQVITIFNANTWKTLLLTSVYYFILFLFGALHTE